MSRIPIKQSKELIILAIYINIDGYSRQQAAEIMQDFIQHHRDMYDDTDKNVKIYWFPGKETKVECVYPPPNIVGDSSFVENELLKIYKLFISEKNDEAKELISHIEKKLKLNSIISNIK